MATITRRNIRAVDAPIDGRGTGWQRSAGLWAELTAGGEAIAIVPFMKTHVFYPLAALVLILAGGCKPSSKDITSLQRKEAATLVSEAQFAQQLKDNARAEGLLAKATALCPDTGKYWVDLGSIRVRLGQKESARAAYQSALAAYEADAKKDPTDVGPVMQQIYVLALLGRVDDARTVLAKGVKQFPDSRAVRAFSEGKQIDKMIADARFREIAL